MKTVYILRAVSGAGKSTVAEHIYDATIKSDDNAIICCADDYFTDENGKYNWKAEQIGMAHAWCKIKFENALEADVDTIIVSNTNTRESDVNHYRNLAISYGYIVFVLVVENWHNGKDVHNVPEDTKSKMKDQLRNSIKF